MTLSGLKLLSYLLFEVCVAMPSLCATLKVYQTDLCQIFRVGRTMGVDDQSEISFSSLQGTLPWQSNFVGFGAWVLLDTSS